MNEKEWNDMKLSNFVGCFKIKKWKGMKMNEM